MNKTSHDSKIPGGRRSSSFLQEPEDIVREEEEMDYESDTVYSPKAETPPSRENFLAHAGSSVEHATDDNITSLR